MFFAFMSFNWAAVTYSAALVGKNSLRIRPMEMGMKEPLRPKVGTSLVRRTVTVVGARAIFFLPRTCCPLRHSCRPKLLMRRRHDVHCGRSVGRMVKDMVVLCIAPACTPNVRLEMLSASPFMSWQNHLLNHNHSMPITLYSLLVAR